MSPTRAVVTSSTGATARRTASGAAEHDGILEALRQRDPDAAATAMRAHIANSYARLGPALARRAEGASE
ncbi:FCD domain-containing protein [Microbacterium sp. H83]|uniref:FCD domain-containing protein n=1 Tax=Microbacterium sp. H83 TaxID=1827324 RepID=UPI000A9DB6EA|nr:FCD domain-containing protein [Microbacterium sp. H83]